MTAIPDTMRCVIAKTKGGPEVLTVESRPVPQPRAGEVLIRVEYAGVSRPDIMQRKGIFVPPPGASDVLGLEASGTVAALGDGVKDLAVGDKVAALLLAGGYAEYVTTDARHCLKLPDGMSMRDAGALPEVVFTVWHNLFELGRLTPGETVLIHGGASGIGTMAIQLAAATGATAYATVGSRDKSSRPPQELRLTPRSGPTTSRPRWPSSAAPNRSCTRTRTSRRPSKTRPAAVASTW
jgi:NADPH:quinone reductase